MGDGRGVARGSLLAQPGGAPRAAPLGGAGLAAVAGKGAEHAKSRESTEEPRGKPVRGRLPAPAGVRRRRAERGGGAESGVPSGALSRARCWARRCRVRGVRCRVRGVSCGVLCGGAGAVRRSECCAERDMENGMRSDARPGDSPLAGAVAGVGSGYSGGLS
ncbi:unnamed protein product [Coccothraustes coccothraustes]